MQSKMAELIEDSKYKKYFIGRFNRDIHPHMYLWEKLMKPSNFEKLTFKSEDMSETKRLKGNEILATGDIYGAIKMFTESVGWSENNSTLIAKAFGNRSAASFEGGLYPECIKDIELAFQHGYPEKDSYKLLIRQAAAYNFLNKKSELKKTIRKIIELDPDLTEEKIMNVLKEKKRKERIIESYCSDKLPSVAYGKSSEAPCASSALRIDYDDKYGRHLVATRDIKMGDTLIVEESYSYFLLHHSRYNHCNFCLKHCITLIPCDNCNWALFCSEKCLDEANRMFHKEECVPISRFLLASFSGLCIGDKLQVPFAMRTLAKVGYKNLQPYFDRMNRKEQILSKEEKRSAGFVDGVYDSTNFETIFNLQDHYEKEDPRNIKATSGEAQVVIRCLEFDLKDEYTQDFAALYMKLRLNQEINCFLPVSEEVYYLDNIQMTECGEIKCDQLMSSGYYPYHHLIAHSCSPNVASYVNGNTIITYALEPIYKGDKIFISYCDGCKHERMRVRKEIKETHHFLCDCEMCIKFTGLSFDELDKDLNYPQRLWDLSKKLSLKPDLLYELLKYRNDRKKFINKITQDITVRNDFRVLNHSKYKDEFIVNRVAYAVRSLSVLKGSIVVIKDSTVNYPRIDFKNVADINAVLV